MNNELTCPALAERFNKALEKLEQDKEAMKKIQERNLWEMIFSNNIRDLARAGISQNEIISEMHLVLQDMLELIQKSGEQQKDLVEELHEAVRRQAGVNADFNEKIIRLVTDLLSQSVQLEELENKTTDIQCRLIQKEQIEHAETEIVEIALRKERQPLIKFEHICKSIAHHLVGYSIPDFYKRKLCLCLKDREFGNRLFSAEELNSIQAKIVDIFAPFHDSRNQHVTAIGRFLFDEIALPEGKMYSMNEMLTSIVDAVMISEAERYGQFRDQLLRLLDQFPLETDDAEGGYAEALTAIRKRLKENQFEIALIGEFQGGKSTTFNMLCDGREISPRGLKGGGLKTSAAVITVQNIEGEETRNGLPEWAEIDWLSSQQLKKRIIDVLERYDEEQTYLVYDADQNSKNPNPEKSSWDAITDLLEVAWNKKLREEELDSLQIATLQYRLCSSKDFDRISQEKIVPVDQFQKWVTFPVNWKGRWANKFKADFSLDEMLFVAVDRVLVRIHSDALAYLGCRITDCPGLFVNKWDTERAIDVMRNANAIWYLLNGDKEIGKNDSSMLQNIIEDRGWHDKCFFSINRRKGMENTTDIMKADIEKLKVQEFKPEHVFVYDALLAFRLQQLKQLNAGLLMPRDFECLAIEATTHSNAVQAALKELKGNPEKCRKELKRLIQKHLGNIDEDDIHDALDNASEITFALISRMEQIAGEQEILNAIGKMLITDRGYSILIAESSEKCLKILESFKKELEGMEKAASITLNEAEEKFNDAKEKLEKFEAEWKENFDFLRAETLDDNLAIDFFRDNDESIKDKIRKRAIKICKEEWNDWSILPWKWKTYKSVNRATEKRIKEEFSLLVQGELEKYQNRMKEKPIFHDTISAPLKRALKKMSDCWKELQEENDLLSAIEIISADDIESIALESFDRISGTVDTPSYFAQFFITIFTFGVIDSEARIEEFFNEKDPVGHAYDAFKGNNDNAKKIANILGSLRRNYVRKLDACVMNIRKTLEDKIQEQLELVKKENTEKERIAEIAQNKREKIETYSGDIEKYQQEVKRFYVK